MKNRERIIYLVIVIAALAVPVAVSAPLIGLRRIVINRHSTNNCPALDDNGNAAVCLQADSSGRINKYLGGVSQGEIGTSSSSVDIGDTIASGQAENVLYLCGSPVELCQNPDFTFDGTTLVVAGTVSSSEGHFTSVGSSGSDLHSFPGGNDDLVSVDATQTLTAKTLTTPVINGASSASGNFDLSGSSGTFKTTTGAATFGNSSYSLNSAFTDMFGYSMVRWAAGNTGSLTGGASDSTVGVKFYFLQPVTVTGIRFYWIGGLGAKTIKVSLWDPGGSVVGSTTVAVNAAGTYTGSITPVTIAATSLYQGYTVGMYNQTSSNYTYTAVDASHPGGATQVLLQVSPWIAWTNNNLFSSGDARPTSSAGSQYYPVEPVFTVP